MMPWTAQGMDQKRSGRSLAISIMVAALTAIHDGRGAEAQTGPETEAVHEELRDLKSRLEDATNRRDLDALALELAPDAIVTTMTNEVLRGPEQLKAYIRDLFEGEGRLIDSMTVQSEADELSRLYADNRIAVSTGSADASFRMAVGTEFDWPIRWTAVLQKESDKWLITNLHFSANSIDNPLISAARSVFGWLPWATAAVGLLAGFAVVRLTRRTPAV